MSYFLVILLKSFISRGYLHLQTLIADLFDKFYETDPKENCCNLSLSIIVA